MSQLSGNPPSSASMSAPPPDFAASTSKPKKAKKKVSGSETHINPSPVPEMSSAVPLDANGERQRGPVEEVIAKRMRQLGKKLVGSDQAALKSADGEVQQRYRTYATQPIQGLNADQRAALISLPSLEGAYKELEELTRDKGPVDVCAIFSSLGTPAGCTVDAEEWDLTSSTGAGVDPSGQTEGSDRSYGEGRCGFRRQTGVRLPGWSPHRDLEVHMLKQPNTQDALVQPLSRFLRLHAVLHPARTSDHEHLVLGKLTLSSALRDALQPSDVLRVGRLYEDLMAGEGAAKGLLNGLVKGVTGEDEESEYQETV